MELIFGVGLAGYRSFGHSPVQYAGPLGKVNLIAGQNNAGKSNLLRAIQQMIPAPQRGGHKGLKPLDAPAGHMMADQKPRLALALDRDTLASQIDSAGRREPPAQLVEHLTSMLQGVGDLLWFVYTYEGGKLEPDDAWIAEVMPPNGDTRVGTIRNASSALSSQSGGKSGEDLKRVVGVLGPAKELPNVKTIPAFRQIQPAEDTAESFDGLGLIGQVARLQDPAALDHRDRHRFDAIQDFVRNVLDDDALTINVPHDRKTINVRLSGGEVLPLEHMGTGIHQVVILAAAATLMTDTLVCVEEPEIHLHPLLQRKLVRYLHAQTTNQYLIATHSAHMLDATVASIFHITRGKDGASQVRAAVTSEDRFQICTDLGYRASDLVQANAIIWVEGPSDRVYVRHWIRLVDPDLVEGIHFSIMFYGGRLLNHLSADDPDVEDFISLRRLNRHVAIVIDSDKTSPQKRINRTKQRVKEELDGDGGGLVWVTAGYTIENYVPEGILREAIETSHRNSKLVRFGRYENPLGTDATVTGIVNPDKLRIAREVVDRWGTNTVGLHDLRRQVDALVAFIHTANGTNPPGLEPL